MTKVKQGRLAFSLTAIVIISACNPSSQLDYKINNDLFQVYFDAKPVLIAGATTYNGVFVLNEVDTFYYDIGFVISNLSEDCKEVVYTKDSVELLNSSHGVVYVRDKQFDVDKLRRQNIEFFSSGDLRVKMTYPIDTVTNGLIGIYVDSVLNTRLGNVKMNLFSYGLKKTSYEQVKCSLRKIKFSKWDTSKVELPYGSYYIN